MEKEAVLNFLSSPTPVIISFTYLPLLFLPLVISLVQYAALVSETTSKKSIFMMSRAEAAPPSLSCLHIV